ncbi:MAG: RHS repeat-associated core domain-containing protein [Gammaproteobacteria bacterium]
MTYGYDNANRRTTLTLPNGIQLTYGFDNANELTGLTYKLGATTVGSLTYGYDNDGRIVSRGGTLDSTNLPAALASASYDANNRLTQWGTKTLTYDTDGNLTTDGTNAYTWNTRNQLTGITGGSTASFVYDALGRRESKTIGGTATNFLYDGLNLEQELNGTTPTVNYLTGANIDEMFSRTDSTGTESYLTDNLGSTLALTSSSGAIQTSYTYEPYGNTTATGTSSTNSLQYTGRENDGTGLYYYRARYYSPGYGRFITEDPLGLAAGQNLYAYAGNNPINWVDPTGQFYIPFTHIWIPAGEMFGAEAAQYWADKQVETANWLYAIPGLFASLWTPCTSTSTIDNLATFAVLGPASRGLAAAADAVAANARPLAQATWLAGTLLTAERGATTADVTFKPVIEAVQQEENIQAVTDGINAENAGKALNPPIIEGPDPNP